MIEIVSFPEALRLRYHEYHAGGETSDNERREFFDLVDCLEASERRTAKIVSKIGEGLEAMKNILLHK